jgi:hypothetical protein
MLSRGPAVLRRPALRLPPETQYSARHRLADTG